MFSLDHTGGRVHEHNMKRELGLHHVETIYVVEQQVGYVPVG